MPARVRVYRICEDVKDKEHGKPHDCFAVDARELVASGAYSRTRPTDAVAPEPDPPSEDNPPDAPPAETQTNEDGENPIAGLKRDQLVDLAGILKITNSKTMNKEQLVEAINSAVEQNPGLSAKVKGFVDSFPTE